MDNPMELQIHCAACTKVIASGDGHLTVPIAAVLAVMRSEDDFEEAYRAGADAAELLAFPKPAQWNAWHWQCGGGENDDGPPYSIPIEELRTWIDLTRWTAYLMSKVWLSSTDWYVVLGRAVEGRGSVRF